MRTQRPWTGTTLVFTLLAVLCLGRSQGRTAAPAGWHRVDRGQPFVSQAVLASTPPPFNAWSLAAYEALVSDTVASTLEVDAVLPESGGMSLTLNHEAAHETRLVVVSGASPMGVKVNSDGSTTPLACTGSLGVVGPGPIQIRMAQADAGWSASTDGQTLQCPSDPKAGTPAIASGLRRMSVKNITQDTVDSPSPLKSSFASVISVAFGIYIALALLSRWSRSIAIGVAVASLSGWVMVPLDGARTVEILRLVDADGHQLPLIVSWIAMVLTGSVGIAIRWAIDGRGFNTIGVTLALFLGIAAAWPVIGTMGWLYAGFGGLSLAGLIWVNVHAHRIRHYNWMALALAFSLLGSLEVMIRYSHVGSLWNAADEHHGTGSMNTLFQQFEGLEAGVHSVYPSGGFPVQVPPKQAPLRMACLGASSTGGAFQNDSLDEFYPARVSERSPPTVEVINQGVGGWTSLHVRAFLEGHSDAIDADIWTIYLGVNEHMPTRMTYADLYTVWKTGGFTVQINALDNIRLFQALRLLSRGLASSAGAGVPPDDYRENLNSIAALAAEQGAKVLLMNEGIRPDPQALWQYTAVMQEVAANHSHVEFIDTASSLDAVGDGAFMDSNHLTELGHETVATTMATALQSLGWW